MPPIDVRAKLVMAPTEILDFCCPQAPVIIQQRPRLDQLLRSPLPPHQHPRGSDSANGGAPYGQAKAPTLALGSAMGAGGRCGGSAAMRLAVFAELLAV
jgi:hypothetical protein